LTTLELQLLQEEQTGLQRELFPVTVSPQTSTQRVTLMMSPGGRLFDPLADDTSCDCFMAEPKKHTVPDQVEVNENMTR